MKILGLSAFYHDSAAVLLDKGEIIAAVQEERFSRKKHDSSFPLNSIEFCLKKGGISLTEIDFIAYYDKPFLTFDRLLFTYLSYAPYKGFHSFRKAMPLWMGKKLNLKSHIRKTLKKHFAIEKKKIPKILFNYHHLSHASSAFFPSPYQEAAILCLDGVGEWATSSGWLGSGPKIEALWQINFPHSLGLFYSTFTEYCGFKVNSGEYKLMGLAPYGEPKYINQLKDNVICIKEDGSFSLNMKYFNYPVQSSMAHPRLYKLLSQAPRKKEGPLVSHYMDVAASVQKITEEVILNLSVELHRQTSVKNLCLAGGVALNCVANGILLRKSPFSSLWVQPAPGDAGGALGAAYSVWHQFLKKPSIKKLPDAMKGALLGPEYSDKNIEKMLKNKKAIFTKLTEEDLLSRTVECLEKGLVVGWFQGRVEFGPRALGNRSILADPRNPQMQKIINLKIKFRESFRPFAVSILRDQVADYFDRDHESPYMILVSWIKEQKRKNSVENSKKETLLKLPIIRSEIPATTHVDYSTRIQTVNEHSSPLYYKLLKEFYKKTGCPALINTSFNVRGEPIVCSPDEAYHCFMNTGLDALCLGSFFLMKSDNKNSP